ncbi:MAG TPA: signal peptidase II [Candidatus Acidoferrales bacterium]|nr:signal peptidase II [Candidatus Acidoferrales bacterium]
MELIPTMEPSDNLLSANLTSAKTTSADLRLRAYGIAAAVFALDRLTKWLIETRVSLTDTYNVIPGFFDIVRSENRGVAFGIFNDGTSEWRSILLVALSLAAVLGVGLALRKANQMDGVSVWAFSLILGGAAGNVFDRIIHGRVTDFLELYAGEYHWPTFNVADSAIVIASGLLLIDLLRPWLVERKKRKAVNVP